MSVLGTFFTETKLDIYVKTEIDREEIYLS